MTPHEEMLQRLALDRSAIDESFGWDRAAGPVLEVRSGLSDPHDGGRTVAAVQFASGLRVVYKPRPVGLEAAFERLVAWWNRSGDLSLLAPRVLNRGAYGWMEFVTHAGCGDDKAAGRYWERAGALIALATLLDATDLHHGNVIAYGEYPVLVDLETALQPRWPGEDRTLLDTGLVPAWIRGPDGGSYDVSGFGAIAPQSFRGTAVPVRENVLRVAGEIVSPLGYADRLVAGLLRAGTLLVARREELVHQLEAFARRPVRVILRHTETYRAVRDGRRPLEPGTLLCPVPEPRALDEIVETERAALERGDIPRFTATEGVRAESYAALIARARGLERTLFEEQARLLRTALALWGLGAALASGDGRSPAPLAAEALAQQHQENGVEERSPYE